MGVSEILSQLDREIARLEHARALLKGKEAKPPRTTTHRSGKKATPKRNLTPEGRRRIAEAVRRRWARQKGQSAASR